MATYTHCDRDGCETKWSPERPRLTFGNGSHQNLTFCSFECLGKHVDKQLKANRDRVREERRWATKMARLQARDKAKSTTR